MKNYPKSTSLFAAAALIVGSTLNAAATDPVGYVSKDYPAGSSLIASPLQGATSYQGTVASVSTTVVGLSSVPSLATPHFLLVTSGTAAGQLSTINSSDASSVTLESEITGLTNGDTVKLIEHFTLGDLTAASSSSFVDNSTVTVYNSDGTINVYTSFSNVWYNAGFAASDDVIVFPGEGVVVSFQSPTTLTFTGAVNTQEIIIPVTSGVVNIISSESPTALTGDSSLGAALSGLPDNSTITVYSEDGGLAVQETYTIFSGVWYDSGFATNEISIASPSTIVLSPQSTADVTLPPAYTAQ